MNYPKEFFNVNLSFAWKVSDLGRQPIEETLLHYTNLYVRFGLGWDLDPANPIWQEYLEGLLQAQDFSEWTYQFYLKRQQQIPAWLPTPSFGCFSYTVVSGNRIRLHFHNNEPQGDSPLRRDRMDTRLAELRDMFGHIKRNVDSPTTVIGTSWLYNLEVYRRLFPPAYLSTAQAGEEDFPYLPLWGQFVDHCGRAREDRIARFLERLEKQNDLAGINQCFPLQALHLESSIEEFYPFYRV